MIVWPGLRRCVSAIQRLFNSAAFYAPLTHTAVPTRAAPGTTGTFTRATTATWTNNDGYLVTGVAGEIGFVGARRVRNLLATTSENLSNAAWTKGGTTLIATGVTDPLGTTRACTITGNGGDGLAYQAITPPAATGYVAVNSAYIRRRTGTGAVYLRSANNVNTDITSTLTTEWQRFETAATAPAAGSWYFVLAVAVAGDAIDVAFCQCEDVTAQTTKTAGEYVSVGVVQRNLLKQSNKFDDTTIWVPTGSPTPVQNLPAPSGVDCDGGWTLTDNAAGAEYSLQATPTLTASDYIYKVFVAKTTGAQSSYPLIEIFNSGVTRIALCTVDTSNGVATVWTAYTGLTVQTSSATCVSWDSNYWLVSLTFTATSEAWNAVLFPAGTANATQSTGAASVVAQGSAGFAGAMLSLASVDQTYQAVGGSYIYHGSFVDGVKCFPTDLDGNPLPTRATYDAVSLPGVAGSYVSTPDSAAASITGDIDIRVKAALTDWTPSTANMLASKYVASGNQKSYALQITTTSGRPALTVSTTGANDVSYTSTVGTGFTDGATGWVRATRDSTTGDVVFYTSSDGESWSQLGTTQTGTAGAIFDSTAGVDVGAYLNNGSLPASGKIYQAQIYNGIDGTLAVDFDASRYEGGTTLTGSTGETWTLNGNAVIHPTNNPMTTPLIELAGTNLCLQSNAFTTSWVNSPALSTLTQNVTGPDGATSAWTLTDSDAGQTCRIYQSNPTLTAAAYTLSIFVKKTTGVQAAYPVIQCYPTAGSANMALVGVDTSNGVATAWTAFTGFTMAAGISAACVSFNTDYWRVSLTFTGTATNYYVVINPAAITNPIQSTGAFTASAVGTTVFYGAQVELGTAATSYIPTTTGAATRNADQLYWTGADIANIKAIAAVDFKREVGFPNAGIMWELNDGTTNDLVAQYLSSATDFRQQGSDGAVTQWNPSAATYTPGTLASGAVSFAANDVKMSFNGATQTADTSATIPSVTRLYYGSELGTFQLNGYPGKIYGWTRNLSQSELNAVSKL